MTYSKQWTRYLSLMEERPESFINNGKLTIVTDWETVHSFDHSFRTSVDHTIFFLKFLKRFFVSDIS